MACYYVSDAASLDEGNEEDLSIISCLLHFISRCTSISSSKEPPDSSPIIHDALHHHFTHDFHQNESLPTAMSFHHSLHKHKSPHQLLVHRHDERQHDLIQTTLRDNCSTTASSTTSSIPMLTPDTIVGLGGTYSSSPSSYLATPCPHLNENQLVLPNRNNLVSRQQQYMDPNSILLVCFSDGSQASSTREDIIPGMEENLHLHHPRFLS